ncbi:TrbI/VirB10 family protein [Phenylobacterium aquaticum]|uniref:TrbI/VirB10 family protein n=1 Tax=Phenylobacterium aquaticum TaxID=1763816 RepID=UPI001F5CBA64|nr:TrbI/VirB10 family protein [Phenylobacterium aquaticum]MCI3131090.1 hypothetical protein [Phenylobacterium aquaticum]
MVGALALGAATFVSMSHQRTAPATPAAAAPATPVPLARDADRPTPPPAAAPAPTPGGQLDPNQSRALPMVVDNTGLEAGSPRPAETSQAAPGQAQGLSQDEQFAGRVGAEAPPVAHATALSAPSDTVVQGALIAAVLETAVNSDLPGYARALVSRDVRSFDGARVLIPRGSRLVGQYKSGVATGQSRVFIIWTRLIRPDGVSIQLASPAMDANGETGVAGRVDRHFLQRFGSAMLLSVVGGAAQSLGDSSSNTLVIGTSTQAQSAAAQAVQTDGRIAPTVRAAQGAPIQVFVARDLVF